jgi:hypothetical protein
MLTSIIIGIASLVLASSATQATPITFNLSYFGPGFGNSARSQLRASSPCTDRSFGGARFTACILRPEPTSRPAVEARGQLVGS